MSSAPPFKGSTRRLVAASVAISAVASAFLVGSRSSARSGVAVVAAAPTAPASEAPFLDVPAGIPVPVHLTERISSQDARARDRFGFVTERAVRFGTVDVPAGTPGRGHVVAAEAGRGAHGGHLSIEADELDLPSGRIAVAMQIGGGPVRTSEGEHLPIPVPVNGSIVLVGPNGGARNNVVFEKGTRLTVVSVPNASPLPLPT